MTRRTEIIQVKNDNGVLAARLPKWWTDEQRIKRGNYLVWRSDKAGDLKLTIFDKEVKHGKGIKQS